MASVPAVVTAPVRRKARRRVRVLPTIVTLAIIGGLGWWGWATTHPVDTGVGKMLTAVVTLGDLVESISATGSVTAQTGAQVKIGSQITGTIKRLYADVGSYVHKNQIIAELDLPDMRAQLDQAQASLASAQTKLQQQISGVSMVQIQSTNDVGQARANVSAAQARLASAQADSLMQGAQTPADISRATTALAAAQAALSTTKSTLNQVAASGKLQVSTAQNQVIQTKATANNAQLELKREQQLLAKGFVAASVVDAAQASSTVAQSLVSSATQNVELVQEKVAADTQTATDQVTQAEQTVAADAAAVTAARAGKYNDQSKIAAVGNARAGVRQAEAALKIAQGNTSNDILKHQDVQTARSAVKVAAGQVAYYQAQLAKTLIRSPIDGTVLQLASQQGETLAAGLSAPTLIIVADLNRLQIDVFVDETDIGKVKLHQEADVTVDAFPKKIFKGLITKVASGSTIQQGVITYDVTVAIQDPRHQLKPDMTASVTIVTGKRTNVLLVPSEAVKLGTKGSTVSIPVVTDGKTTIQPVRVKTGGSDGKFTEIRDGLKEGQTIVLAGGETAQRGGGGPSSPFGPAKPAKKGGK